MPLRVQDGESSRTPNNGDSYKKYQGWRRQKIPERTIMDGTDAGSANTQLAIVPKHQRSWNKVRLPRSNATGLEKDGQRMVVDAQMKCSSWRTTRAYFLLKTKPQQQQLLFLSDFFVSLQQQIDVE